MKIELNIDDLSVIDPTVKSFIQELSMLQAQGSIPKPSNPQDGVLVYEIKNRPFQSYQGLMDEEKLTISEYPLFIYAPVSILQQDVWEGLPDRYDGESVKTFESWGVAPGYTNPIRQNETHVVLRTNIGGQFLTIQECQVLLSQHGVNGIEILGVQELKAKETEFNTEE